MPRVIHFEVSADDPERACGFYGAVFGWEINRWGPVEYWLASTGPRDEPGIDGAIMPREPTGPAVAITIAVPSVDEYLDRIEAAGGTVVRSKMAIPGVGYHAYCSDTEGNPFGIMEEDADAA